MVPFFLLGSLLTAAVGAAGAAWYQMLEPEDKAAVDQKAHDFAVAQFKKRLVQLSPAEIRNVNDQLKAHFDI